MSVAEILERSDWQFNEVQPENLDYVWSTLQKYIDKALSTGQGDETCSELMKEMVRNGDMKMWAIHQGGDIVAAMVFTLRQSMVRKMYIEMLVGERMSEWFPTLQELGISFCADMNADCIEASVRPGMAKALEKAGWSKKATIMELKT